jgi:serine phosphatase RsbU (regulator of sigma subunit)/catechol 2,3-dioxygenase-like lactoylglutathione lyase family enzyme
LCKEQLLDVAAQVIDTNSQLVCYQGIIPLLSYRPHLLSRKGHTVPEKPNLDPASSWLTDRIVSVESAQEQAQEFSRSPVRLDAKDPYLRLQFVSIYVSDQERSLRFFVDQLGFRLLRDVRFASGNRWIEVGPPDGTATLTLVLPRPDLEEESLVGHSGPVTFLTEDVEAKYREWLERGVKFTLGLQTPAWGGAFCRFEDVDGNPFALAGFDDATRLIAAGRRAYTEHLEAKRRAEQELEIAKQVQARLFPQRLPEVPGLDYAGLCMQALSVGGDYYDFLDLGSGHTALVVGDIAGKGIAAALLMANLQANLRSQCINAVKHPEQVLATVNRLLFENSTESAYATLFYVEFNNTNGCLRYANCGHLPALILRASATVERLGANCTVVGLFEEWQCSMLANCLGPGDLLALYTDGVTESPNTAGEEFGEERLSDALRRHRDLPAKEMVAAVVDDVVTFSASEQFDDITLIVAKAT